MITQEFAQQFAEKWINAMNRQDIDSIISNYAENVEFTSPLIPQAVGEKIETIQGRNTIRNFWEKIFKSIPDLRFGLYEFFTSANSLVIYYKALTDKRACDMFYFDEQGKVLRAIAHYN